LSGPEIADRPGAPALAVRCGGELPLPSDELSQYRSGTQETTPMPRIRKMLLVEDQEEVGDLLAEVLELEGFRLTVVKTGAQMHDAFDKDDYDVAIIDVVLPGGEGGFALAETARERGCGIILITGDHRYAERLQQSGHHYLLKPFRVNAFLALVDSVSAEAANLRVHRKRGDGLLPEIE
jgi:DNA-binding response OmpR family regulator